MLKQVYMTEYNLKDGELYSSYVLAYSEQDALNKITRRNIGERLRDSQPLSTTKFDIIDAVELFDLGKFKHCLHAVTFMSYILARAGKIDPIESLSDRGIIHELIHIVTNIYTNQSQFLNTTFKTQLIEFQELFDNLSH